MSTGVIIAIVVVVVLVALLVAVLLSPAARTKRRERELGQRRDHAVETHRTEASAREREAAEAEKRARVAAAEAQRQQAEAELHRARADEHEQGLADPDLIEDDERRRFAGTSAVTDADERHAQESTAGTNGGTAAPGRATTVTGDAEAPAVRRDTGEPDPRTNR